MNDCSVRKRTIIWIKNEINFVWTKEKTPEMGPSRTMNQRNEKKPNVPISSFPEKAAR